MMFVINALLKKYLSIVFLLGVLSIVILMRVYFNKGVSIGTRDTIAAYELASKQVLDKRLIDAQGKLKDALNHHREGLKAIENLNLKYSEVKQTKEKLQQDLNDAINNPPNCNKLDPRYFRLYQSMYNQPAP